MKICVIGTGGLGGFFGGWLAASGADVSFIARGAHLEAIRTNGLRVVSALGDKHIVPAHATDDPAEIGPVDIILFCVKTYDLDNAAEMCRPMLKPDNGVISLLNGVTAPHRIAAILGRAHAVPGLTLVPSNIAAPGVVEHFGDKIDILFGELDGSQSPRLLKFRDFCRTAGLDAQISTDITTAIWNKFVAWSSISAVACASRAAFGTIQSTPELMTLFRDMLIETQNVGRAKGAAFPDDLVDVMEARVRSYPPEARPSMLVDLERGNRTELETACGAVVALGTELGVDTPLNRALYALLLPYKGG